MELRHDLEAIMDVVLHRSLGLSCCNRAGARRHPCHRRPEHEPAVDPCRAAGCHHPGRPGREMGLPLGLQLIAWLRPGRGAVGWAEMLDNSGRGAAMNIHLVDGTYELFRNFTARHRRMRPMAAG